MNIQQHTRHKSASARSGILNGMWARIGSRPGQWLNSLALIGKRIAAEAYGGAGARFYADDDKPAFRVDVQPKAARTAGHDPDRIEQFLAEAKRREEDLSAIAAELQRADGAKVLARRLFTRRGKAE